MRFSSWFGRPKYRTAQRPEQQQQPVSLSTDLTQNLLVIHRMFTKTPDLIVRHFTIKQSGASAALVYLDGLADKNSINNNVLRPLQYDSGSGNDSLGFTVTVGQFDAIHSWHQIEAAILHASSILFINGRNEAYSMDTAGWPQRAIEDPQLETSLKGAHQGFVETGSQNIALIRRYIPNRELKTLNLTVGQRGETKVSVMYLADVAHPEVLKELEDRINQLDVDVILNTGLPILSAVRVTLISYGGLECVFLLYPFLQNKQRAAAAVVISNTLTLLVLLFITFVCFVFFSPDEITQYNEPVVNVLKTIEFKFMERIEILFIAFYLFNFSLCRITTMYLTVFCTSWIFGKQDHRGHLRTVCLILALFTFFFCLPLTRAISWKSILALPLLASIMYCPFA